MTGSRARDVVRRAVGALTVTALLGAAAAAATGLTWPGAAAPPDPRTPTDVAPSPARTISPTRAPTAGAAGITLTARPEPDGSFLVEEVVALPAAVTEVVLRPPSVRGAGRGFERRRPAAVDVAIRAGEQDLAIPDGPVHHQVVLRWSAPTAQLRLRYRLTQVSVTSAHAKRGRALAALGSLLDRMPADLPVTAVVRGKTILSLTCPQLSLDRLACGAGAAPRFWTLDPIPYDRSRVLVQYDRPAAR